MWLQSYYSIVERRIEVSRTEPDANVQLRMDIEQAVDLRKNLTVAIREARKHQDLIKHRGSGE